ncbi:MAG: fasciclin domain-containing protein [Thermales bacterium]|nr:fasciclin domain-containing protein [Thermales bacterium]
MIKYNNNLMVNFNSFLIRTSLVFFAAVLFFMIGLSVNAQNTENLLEIVQNEEELSTFSSAVMKAGFEDLLLSEGPNTVFAPSNEAIEALPDGVLAALLMDENIETLKTILNYHIVNQDLNSTQVLEGGSFETMNSTEELVVSQDGETVFLNEDSRITRADFDGNNGYVHIIDKVLIPSSVDVNQFVVDQAETTPRTGGVSSLLGYSVFGVVAILGGMLGFSGDRFSSVKGFVSR